MSKKMSKNMMKMTLLAMLIICVSSTMSQGGFKISGTQLLDDNGNNFIMKGLNVPLAWFVYETNDNIANIRNVTGANCLRIVLETRLEDEYWQPCIQKCIDNQMIPMIELHDVTCSTDASALNNMASDFAANAAYYKGANIAKYILINIANEWGDWQLATNNPSAWRDAYKTAITTIRNAGIVTTLVIDAPNCGQDRWDGQTIRTYAQELQDYDPQHNLLFSVHFYGEWESGGTSTITTGLPSIKNAGIPIIVGEFCSSCDEVAAMNTCQSNGIGWLAWSWKGNSDPTYTDMSNDWAGTSLTSWGNTAVNGSNGTKTAVICSVFAGGTTSTTTTASTTTTTAATTTTTAATTTTTAATTTTTAATTTSTTATTTTTTTATSTTTTTATTTSTTAATTTTTAGTTTTTTAATTTTTAGTTTTTTAATTTTTASGQTCSPVDAAISAPFTKDGAGTFCWTATACSYINSWNLTTLTVNGVNFTNTYASSSQLPAKINGNWYIYYVGSYSWSHFELK